MTESTNPELSSEVDTAASNEVATPASDSGTQSTGETGFQQIIFSGTAVEYFGIWISNLALTFATLGIYSAWAKVNRLRYFRNNTRVAGYGFGYHATGRQILRGRLIAVAIILALLLAESISALVAYATYTVLIIIAPWAINSSMKFTARMTSYRNVRFDWHGTYWRTFWFFLVAPLFALASLGLLAPAINRHYYCYYATHHSYGTTRFEANPDITNYYIAFLTGVAAPTIVISGVLFTLFLPLVEGDLSADMYLLNYTTIMGPVLLVSLLFSMFSIYPVLCRNITMRSLVLADAMRFGSTIHPVRYLWISLSNMVAIMLSFGFLLPWAKVRMHKYIANSSTFQVTGDMDKFIGDAVAEQSSFGEEFVDFQDMDIQV